MAAPASAPSATPVAARGVPFAQELARFGAAPALIHPGGTLSYADLAARVAAVVDQLGPQRRLVVVEAGSRPEPVAAYLAALAGGHPVLLVPPGGTDEAWWRGYDPDVVVREADGWALHAVRSGSAHELHPDLALLLSTSGSTGSPKLVRLSAANLQSNAEAIACSLGITAADRAITALPLSYCYGLSVLHSHLALGAAVVLTGLSVVDECFWTLAREQAVTLLPAVPHTLDLLDRIGFDGSQLPSLRLITQAGGRLDPDRVRGYARLGESAGFGFAVMYGQTEATARIAVLPPTEAARFPDSVGRPIPGGGVRIDDGELVYTGPNVMLGYAESPDDLARGREIAELRTGDLASIDADGLIRITGRRSRQAKLFGLRIDCGQVEARLAAAGLTACCLPADDRLGLVVEGAAVGEAARRAAAIAGIPVGAVRAVGVPRLPRLTSGKADTAAAAALLAGAAPAAEPEPTRVAELYRRKLGVDRVTEDASFASLGGDSLSYVEVSVALQRLLGDLPRDWHLLPVAALDRLAPLDRLATPHPTPVNGNFLAAIPPESAGHRRGWRQVETAILLRAVGILAVVAAHVGLLGIRGGAHLLLGVAGYNIARFQLASPDRLERLRSLRSALLGVAVPAALWIAAVVAVGEQYPVSTATFTFWILGPFDGPGGHYWFLEALVWLILGLLLLVGVRRFHAADRRRPFAVPMALLAAALLLRYEVGPIDLGERANYTPAMAIWLFAAGWAAARASTAGQRLALTAVLLVAGYGFFPSLARDAVIVGGMLLLLWVPRVRLPAIAVALLAPIAAASLYIYLTHYQVFPPLARVHPLIAFAGALLVGLLAAQIAARVQRRLRGLRRTATYALSRARNPRARSQGESVNRSELVAAVADKAGVSQKDADAVLKAFADTVADALAKKDKVSLPGFLTFDVGFREARTGRNPQTGAEVQIAATHTAKVSAGSSLKAAAAKNN